MPLSHKYKINKKVKEFHRKLRKEANKAKKNGTPVKKSSKVTRIPNLFPYKKEILEEQDLIKAIQASERKNKSSEIKKGDIESLVVEDNQPILVNASNDNSKSEIYKKSKNDLKRELNLIVEKSDFILEILDARDPQSFRSNELEKKISMKDKKLILVLNKIDLISE